MREAGGSVRKGDALETEVRIREILILTIGFDTQGRIHEPREAVGLWKLKYTGKQILSWKNVARPTHFGFLTTRTVKEYVSVVLSH